MQTESKIFDDLCKSLELKLFLLHSLELNSLKMGFNFCDAEVILQNTQFASMFSVLFPYSIPITPSPIHKANMAKMKISVNSINFSKIS